MKEPHSSCTDHGNIFIAVNLLELLTSVQLPLTFHGPCSGLGWVASLEVSPTGSREFHLYRTVGLLTLLEILRIHKRNSAREISALRLSPNSSSILWPAFSLIARIIIRRISTYWRHVNRSWTNHVLLRSTQFWSNLVLASPYITVVMYQLG